MGQAKRRGTFEERREQALIKAEADRLRAIEYEVSRRANMTDAEKLAEHEYKVMLSSYMGLALSSLSNGYFPFRI